MSRRYRLVFFGLALLILISVGKLSTGTFKFLFFDFWFTSGLLLLILLSVVDQPFFSKDANIFMNGVAGLISLSAVGIKVRNYIWYIFLVWSIYLIVSSYILMIIRARRLSEEGRFITVLSRLNREIGRPKALFSAFFLWGVITQFTPNSREYRILLLYWSIFLILNIPGVASGLSSFFIRKSVSDERKSGIVRSFISPRFFECEMHPSIPQIVPGSSAEISAPDGRIAAVGKVVDDRLLDGIRLVRVALTDTAGAWDTIAQARKQDTLLSVKVAPLDEGNVVDSPAGIVCPGSTIDTLCLHTNPSTDLVEGEVLAVDLPSKRAYYQVVSATLKQESFETRRYMQDVEVKASQLGIWRDDRSRFEPVSWVAPAGGLVYQIKSSEEFQSTIPSGHLEIGKVPNSYFPVHLNLDDVVTHNTAIIGVTGSGKSYLAFRLIEGLIKANIRVLILDISRQHWVFLQKHQPFQMKQANDVDKWLSGDKLIAIHQFAKSVNYTRTTSEIVANVFSNLEGQISLKAGANEPAKMCIVFEEAHSLIPEWNQVPQKDDTQNVNRTARTVLQGRKYGMGCIVVSQRTANVTKTILNQCNTILALQSFDQTGLDFLSNYMGSAYAHVISTLPIQHAVLVGKASSSTRPILFSVQDMSERWK